MASYQVYTYSEILEMYPYEKDAFFTMLYEDAKKQQEDLKKSQRKMNF